MVIVIAVGVLASLITIISGAAWLFRFFKRKLDERRVRQQPPALIPPRRAGISSAATMRLGSVGDDPWAGTYATPGSFAERVRADLRARGVTPSDYINGKR